MTSQPEHLFSHCSEAVCVAEESTVSFFAPTTLKKFRVESFTGARIAGIYTQITSKGSVLHVIDAELHWFTVDLKKITLELSTHISLSSLPGGDPSDVVAAHFYEMQDALYVIILTANGLYDILLRDSAGNVFDASAASRHGKFFLSRETWRRGDTDASSTLLAVGRRTGLVAVTFQGSRNLYFSSCADRHSSSQSCGTRVLQVDAHSLACSPVDDHRVAVGGGRGELAVYMDISAGAHHFSDHWHHTPVTALSFTVDGTSLLTGGAEEVVLVWNTASYTHKKIRRVGWGPIRCVVPSSSLGTTVLVASGFSTLSTVDLLQLTVENIAEGIEWSCDGVCSRFFFSQWMGQDVAVLTGFPNVLRLTDPHTQQSVYSLHVSSQMESISPPKRHGIEFAALLNEGKTIITYERFDHTVLPPQLCFWSYHMVLRHHVLSQTVYSPHEDGLWALHVDTAQHRLFTLSAETMKCWEETLEDPNDAIAVSGAGRLWINQSSCPTPSPCTRAMALSQDGSVCFVADDGIHAYDVRVCAPGVAWPRVRTLSQSCTKDQVVDLCVFDSGVLCGRTDDFLFAWSLISGNVFPMHCDPDSEGHSTFTAMAQYGEEGLLTAHSNGDISEWKLRQPSGVERVRRLRAATPHPVTCLRPVPGLPSHVGIIDSVSGFRVLRLDSQRKVEVMPFRSRQREEVNAERHFAQFFHPASASQGNNEQEGLALWSSSTGASARATRWLSEVMADSPYTAPPMSAVLSQFLERSEGTGAWGNF